MDLYGSHYILATQNLRLIFAVLYIVCISVLLPMRKFFEGVAYNYSYGSKYGDVALISIVLTAGVIFRLGAVLPTWATSAEFHIMCALIGAGVGLFFVFGPTPLWRNQFADNYHNLVVMGLLVYLLLSVAPVILWGGSVIGIGTVLLLLGCWAWLLWVDVKHGRLEQRKYMQEHDPATYFLLTNRED